MIDRKCSGDSNESQNRHGMLVSVLLMDKDHAMTYSIIIHCRNGSAKITDLSSEKVMALTRSMMTAGSYFQVGTLHVQSENVLTWIVENQIR